MMTESTENIAQAIEDQEHVVKVVRQRAEELSEERERAGRRLLVFGLFMVAADLSAASCTLITWPTGVTVAVCILMITGALVVVDRRDEPAWAQYVQEKRELEELKSREMMRHGP